MKIKKNAGTFLILTLLIAAALAVTSWATPSRKVYDEAHLFSYTQEEELESNLAQLIGKMNMDFVVVTVSDKGGKSQAEYADDFYDNGGFGIGENRSGLLFMIDMEDRDCYISTSGDMIDYLTDSRLEDILQYDDELWERLGDEEYAYGVLRVMELVEHYYDKGPVTSGSSSGSFGLIKIIAPVLAGLLAGFSRTRSIRNEYGMKDDRSQAAASTKAYMANTAYAFNTSTDDLIDRQVMRVPMPRPRNDGPRGGGGSHSHSSTHMSSSGHTHGGGGSGGRHF